MTLLGNMRNDDGVKICICGKKFAHTKAEIEELFGYRMSKGKRIEQSWCKECR